MNIYRKSITQNVYFIFSLKITLRFHKILHIDILSLRVRGEEVKKTEGEQVIIWFLCSEEIFQTSTVDNLMIFVSQK